MCWHFFSHWLVKQFEPKAKQNEIDVDVVGVTLVLLLLMSLVLLKMLLLVCLVAVLLAVLVMICLLCCCILMTETCQLFAGELVTDKCQQWLLLLFADELLIDRFQHLLLLIVLMLCCRCLSQWLEYVKLILHSDSLMTETCQNHYVKNMFTVFQLRNINWITTNKQQKNAKNVIKNCLYDFSMIS